jgi:hypothetical protein
MRLVFLIMSVAAIAIGCGTPAPAPTPTQTVAPSPSPSGRAVVTFRVVEEEYRILITDQADLEIAQRLLDGEEAPSIPNGLIVRGETSVNEGWSWSIDPESLEFADMTTEVCDGLPSHVEEGSLTSDYFCPWSAEVVDVVLITSF